MGKAEGYVEKYLKRVTEAAGGLCYKFTSGETGVPDRIVIIKGHTVFVETKSEVGTPRPNQIRQHKRMRGRGADVRVASTRQEVDDLLRELTA